MSWEKVSLDTPQDHTPRPSRRENAIIDNTSMPQNRRKYRKIGKVSAIVLAVILLLGLLVFFTVALPAGKVYADALKTYATVKLAYDAAKKQNVEEAGKQIALAKKDLAQTQQDLQSMGYVKY